MLRNLVRLRENGGAGLCENLFAGELGGLFGHVDVADTRVGGGDVEAVVISRRFMTAPKRARAVDTQASDVSMMVMTPIEFVAAPSRRVADEVSCESMTEPKVTEMRSDEMLLMPTWKFTTDDCWLISETPLNFVDVMIRVISSCSERNSVCRYVRSVD